MFYWKNVKCHQWNDDLKCKSDSTNLKNFQEHSNDQWF
jgi:hypothetical protein